MIKHAFKTIFFATCGLSILGLAGCVSQSHIQSDSYVKNLPIQVSEQSGTSVLSDHSLRVATLFNELELLETDLNRQGQILCMDLPELAKQYAIELAQNNDMEADPTVQDHFNDLQRTIERYKEQLHLDCASNAGR